MQWVMVAITITFMILSFVVLSDAFPNMAFRRWARMTTTLLGSRDLDFGPFQDGHIKVSRGGDTFSLYYRSYNPQAEQTPVLVVHGGPSLPSQYLYPVVPLLGQRPVIFYDQLGCGRSDTPTDLSCYSIAQSVLDLQVVISQVVTAKSFHLLGHSYGGSLAYDYIAYRAMHPSSLPECKSLILSNAAKSMSVVHSEYDRFWKKNPKTFWNEHVCRAGTPALLEDALQHVGRIWGGMDVVLDYVAQSVDDQTAIPSTLVVTGIHDFGYIGSNEEAWKPIIPNLASASLERCAHYPFYEDGETYGRILEDFFEQTERTC